MIVKAEISPGGSLVIHEPRQPQDLPVGAASLPAASTDSAGLLRRLWSAGNRGFTVLVALGVLTLATGFAGVLLDESVHGPAEVPAPPLAVVGFAPGSAAPLNLAIDSFLEQERGYSEFIVTATGTFTRAQKISSWDVDAQGFTGYVCPHQPGVHVLHVPGAGPLDWYLYGQSALSAVSGTPFLTVRLCWRSGAPLVTSGAYISAALPAVLAPLGQVGTVTRALIVSDPPLDNYASAGGIAPSVATGQGWFWKSDISEALDSQARYEIPVVASSLPGLQRDNRATFLSGILFGVAGGALVSMLPALLDAVDRRKRASQPTGEGKTSD